MTPFLIAAEEIQRPELQKAKVESIQYVGNEWFSDRTIGRYFHLKAGDVFNVPELLNDVASVNRSPFHRTKASFVPVEGEKSGIIELETLDRFPLRLSIVADNTGTRSTSEQRYTAGLDWGNAFGLGDVMTYQYALGSSARKFCSHLLKYNSILPWGDTIILGGGYETLHADHNELQRHGRNVRGSARYVLPFRPYYTPFTQQLMLGVDYKGTNTDLFYTADKSLAAKHLIDLVQFLVNYEFKYLHGGNDLRFNFDFVFSPFKDLFDQHNESFGALRPHAKPQYAYLRLQLSDTYKMIHDFSIVGMLRFQAATGPLLPSEQFGLGGYNTVRGYDESSFDADQAFCGNVELRAPPIKVFQNFSNELIFLAFFDYGVGHNFHPTHFFPDRRELIGVGPGLRYNIFPFLETRADWGFKLHKFDKEEKNGMFHFSVTAAY